MKTPTPQYTEKEIQTLTKAVTLMRKHLDDLGQNKGWLGRLCLDVGLCNDAYIALEDAQRLIKSKSGS